MNLLLISYTIINRISKINSPLLLQGSAFIERWLLGSRQVSSLEPSGNWKQIKLTGWKIS